MEHPYLLVVDDAPAAADLALLEEKVAAAPVDVAGLGGEKELAVFVRDDDGRILPVFPGLSGEATASCTRCGSTRLCEVTASRGS